MWEGEAYSTVACLGSMSIEHASLVRRGGRARVSDVNHRLAGVYVDEKKAYRVV